MRTIDMITAIEHMSFEMGKHKDQKQEPAPIRKDREFEDMSFARFLKAARIA